MKYVVLSLTLRSVNAVEVESMKLLERDELLSREECNRRGGCINGLLGRDRFPGRDELLGRDGVGRGGWVGRLPEGELLIWGGDGVRTVRGGVVNGDEMEAFGALLASCLWCPLVLGGMLAVLRLETKF